MKKIVLIALALFLSGCATLEYKGEDAGRVAMGIGATSQAYPTYNFFFRKVGEKDVDDLSYRQGVLFGLDGDKTDYENAQETGVVKSMKLAPGNYEIYNFRIYSPNAFGYTDFYAREEFSIPFTIAPGKTTYLGNYQANAIFGKNIFGFTIPAGAIFVVSDREDTDIALLKKRLTDDPITSVINDTPNVEALGTPYFVDANKNDFSAIKKKRKDWI